LKKIVVYKLALVVVFSLIIPSQAIFAVPGRSPAASQKPQAVKAQEAIVKVIIPAAPNGINISNQTPAATVPSNCPSALATSGSQLQSTGLINSAANSAAALSLPVASPGNLNPAATGLSGLYAGNLNLNEPANCFTLEVSQPVVVPPPLTVESAAVSYSDIKVVVNGASLSSPNLLPEPISSATPIVPQVFFGIVLSYGLLRRKLLKAKIINATALFKESLTLQQLQMLRC